MAGVGLFGRIALKKGLVSESQLMRALRFQEEIRALGLKRQLGQILVEEGVLAESQVAQILRLQKLNQRAQDAKRFGRIACSNNLISQEQLEQALQVAAQESFQRTLEEILEEQDVLDARSVRAIHAAIKRAEAFKKVGDREEEDLSDRPPTRPAGPATGRLSRRLRVDDEKPERRRLDDVTFAAVALREGLLLVPELERAVEEQMLRSDASLETVLIERGVLSAGEVKSVRAAMEESRKERLTIPGYELRDVLGYGVTSIVLAARHAMIDREVAIKLFRAEHVAATTGDALVEEAKAIARVQHPNVVGLYEVGRVHRRIFFVMELIDGPTLMDRIRTEGPLPEAEVLRIARDVSRGLEAIHDAGLVHRDVKPQNILLTSEGQAKLTDLGLVCEAGPEAGPEANDTGALYGSPHTMSPEQAQGDPVDARADLYGLGATLHYALTGVPPYQGTDTVTILMGHMTDPVPDPRDRRLDLSPPTAELVMQLLAKLPEERIQTAGEVLFALEGLLAFGQG